MPLTTVSPGLLDSNAQYTGFKNRLFNGAMGIFQRNTTLSTNNSQGYSVDRMWGFSGLNTAATYSQISSTGLAGFPFAIRCQRTAGNTGTNNVFMGQIVESNNLQDLQGQSVTVSFWARAGANYSPTSSVLNVYLRTGTVADQGLNTLISPGWTGAVQQSSGVTLTTSWQFFSRTFSVASNVQELSAFFEAVTTGTAGANDFYDITGFQLEKGSTATSFDYRPYTTELQLCQRYFQRVGDGGNSFAVLGVGRFASSTVVSIRFPWSVPMRTTPSGSFNTATYVFWEGTTARSVGAISFYSAGTDGVEGDIATTSATTGAMTQLRGNAGSPNAPYINLSAEL
jgi:hypothetical protein